MSQSHIPLRRRGYAKRRHFFFVRYESRRAARVALITVAVKLFVLYLEDRFAALMEAVCTKINWFVIRLFMNPLLYIYDRAGIQGHLPVKIRVYLFAEHLGKPFRKCQFFFTKRRYFLAYVEELLLKRVKTLTKVGNDFCWVPRVDHFNKDGAGEFFDQVYEGASLSDVCGNHQDSRECRPRPNLGATT